MAQGSCPKPTQYLGSSGPGLPAKLGRTCRLSHAGLARAWRGPGSSLARAWPELGPTRSPSPSQHAARVEAASVVRHKSAVQLRKSQFCRCFAKGSTFSGHCPAAGLRASSSKLKAFLTELQVRPEHSRSGPQLPLSLSPESPLAPLGPSHRVAARLGALFHIGRVSAQPRV